MHKKTTTSVSTVTSKLSVINFCFVYFVFILSTFVLPLFSFQGYSLLRNTTSHLGAQGSPNAVVMNIMYILIAVSSFVAVREVYKQHLFHLFVLLLFTASMVLVGVFQHEPLVAIETNTFLAALHSFFATTAGMTFTVLALASAFIRHDQPEKIISAVVGLSATFLSMGMFLFPEIMGLLQRLIFILCYGWLLYVAQWKLSN